MKANSLIPVTLLAVTQSLHAFPFTARQLPAGFNAPIKAGLITPKFFSAPPVAADFTGTGRTQWYSGGTMISAFPVESTITLPGMTLPADPFATVRPVTGTACDVDNDGDMDVVRINEWNGNSQNATLQVFLNTGNGSFTLGYRLELGQPTGWNSGISYYKLAMADYDRDGDADLALLRTYSLWNSNVSPDREEGSLVIRWNDGTGSFGSATTLQTNGFEDESQMAAVDLDGDGDVDLVCDGYIAWNSEGTVRYYYTRIYTNNGAGAFSGVSDQGWVNGYVPASVADINRDGRPDLIGGAGATRIAINNGTGTWTASDASWGTLAVADADDDGFLDLIQTEGNAVVFRRGDGDTTFASTTLVMGSFAAEPMQATAADSDGDGDTDFVVNLTDGTSWFIENRSLHRKAGVLQNSATAVAAAGITDLVTEDFNQDGIEDLAGVSPASKGIWFIFGEADGIPGAGASFKSTQLTAPGGIAAADFNRDGLPDIAYTLPGSGQVRQARNTGGSPGAWTDLLVESGLTGVTQITTGSRGTPDGFTDILTSNATTGQVRWNHQTGGGTSWGPANVLNSLSIPPASLLAAQATSMPGDEVFMLFGDDTTHFMRGYQNAANWTQIGTGFATPVSPPAPARTIAWADANGDGKKEVIFVQENGSLSWWNPVAGNAGTIVNPGVEIRRIVPADWDRDGRTDFLCVTTTGLNLIAWKNGAWSSTPLASFPGLTALTLIDLDRDGWMDAAAANGTHVHFFYNTPALLEAVQAAPAQVEIITGTAAHAVNVDVTSFGRPGDPFSPWSADATAAINSADVYFYRAAASGNSWSQGSILTQAELTQIVSSISLVAGTTVVGSSGPSAISNGKVTVNYNQVLGNLAPISPGSTQDVHIRLTLTAGAATSANARFFVFCPRFTGIEQDGFNVGETVTVGSPASVLVTAIPVPGPLQQWRMTNFGTYHGTGAAANDADPDRDGMVNLMEYLNGQNPNVHGGLGFSPVVGVGLVNGSAIPNLRLLTSYDSKIKLTLQATSNLSSWQNISTRTGTGAWSGIVPASSLLSGGGRTRWEFDGGYSTAIFKKYYFRLKAEELP